MYHVALRNNKTGEVRMCPQKSGWDDIHAYLWAEGSLACDCNRAIEFEYAHSGNRDACRECGDTQYTALYAMLPSGNKIRIDSESKGG